jgi:hypothetical protein
MKPDFAREYVALTYRERPRPQYTCTACGCVLVGSSPDARAYGDAEDERRTRARHARDCDLWRRRKALAAQG